MPPNLFRFKLLLSIPAFAILLLFFVGASTPASAEGESSSSSVCAVTPELLAGQGGYAIAGQRGYAVTGLAGYAVVGLRGYAVTGLGGYALAGQRGYAVTGLNELTPPEREDLLQEIENNTIDPEWIQQFLPYISSGENFNTYKVAVLVVDDFEEDDVNEHGELVSQIFVELKDAIEGWILANTEFGGIQIDFFAVDISVDGSYQLDLIADEISGAVNYIYSELGYQHFVLNMSFGLLPCEDDSMDWDFDEYMHQREMEQGPQSVRPVLECVTNHGDGLYTAHFGYLNENPTAVEIPVSDNNRFSPGFDLYQVTTFQPGRNYDVFRIDFDGSNLVWTLRGPDGSSRTATASSGSSACSGYESASAPIIPQFNCAELNDDETYTVYFGYDNHNEGSVRIAMGEANRFTPPRMDYGQVRVFLPGEQPSMFQITFSGGRLQWVLEGPDGVRRFAKVDTNALPEDKICLDYPEFEEYSLVEYFEDNGQDAGAILATLLQDLNESPEELEDLRVLLQQYLAASANPEVPFQLIALASSGNYATLIDPSGGPVPPLYPAAMKETIAVGATLGQGFAPPTIWEGSHEANALVPGAWYQFSEFHYGAGTSYAAPFASTIAALYLTYPDACEFTEDLPPLAPVAVGLNNVPFTPGVSSPLACSPIQLAVTDLILVNADTDEDLYALDENNVVYQEDLGGLRNITIRAVTTPETGGSVVFDRDAELAFKVENNPPYALNGDNGGDFNQWIYYLDQVYTITATPYSGPDGTGQQGQPLTITIIVHERRGDGGEEPEVNLNIGATCPKGEFIVTNLHPEAVSFFWWVVDGDPWGEVTLPGHGQTTISTGATSGTVALYVGEGEDVEEVAAADVIANCQPQFVSVPGDQTSNAGDVIGGLFISATDPDGDTPIYSATGLPPGLSIDAATGEISGTISGEASGQFMVNVYVSDGVDTVSATFKWTVINEGVGPNFGVTQLILVDADTDLDIMPINDGDVINLATLSTVNLTVRAETVGTVGSVVFGLNVHANHRTENVAPYAMQGDSGGDYDPWLYSTNTAYTLTGTGYADSNGSGDAGTAVTVNFTIVNE